MIEHFGDAVEHVKMLAAQYYTSVLSQLTNHKNNQSVHVSVEDRDRWDNKADKTSIRELELDLVNKANKKDIPQNISDLTNDASYLTTKTLEDKLENLGYVTINDVRNEIENTADLTNYYTKADCDSKFATKSEGGQDSVWKLENGKVVLNEEIVGNNATVDLGSHMLSTTGGIYTTQIGSPGMQYDTIRIGNITTNIRNGATTLQGSLELTGSISANSITADNISGISYSGVYNQSSPNAYRIGTLNVGNSQYQIFGKDETGSGGGGSTTVTFTPNQDIVDSVYRYIIGTLNVNNQTYTIYGKDRVGEGGGGDYGDEIERINRELSEQLERIESNFERINQLKSEVESAGFVTEDELAAMFVAKGEEIKGAVILTLENDQSFLDLIADRVTVGTDNFILYNKTTLEPALAWDGNKNKWVFRGEILAESGTFSGTVTADSVVSGEIRSTNGIYNNCNILSGEAQYGSADRPLDIDGSVDTLILIGGGQNYNCNAFLRLPNPWECAGKTIRFVNLMPLNSREQQCRISVKEEYYGEDIIPGIYIFDNAVRAVRHPDVWFNNQTGQIGREAGYDSMNGTFYFARSLTLHAAPEPEPDDEHQRYWYWYIYDTDYYNV